jgi:hypothetical protein
VRNVGRGLEAREPVRWDVHAGMESITGAQCLNSHSVDVGKWVTHHPELAHLLSR